MELEEGQLLGGRYRLGARLGRSEIGETYAALDQTLNRECAVKVLAPAIAHAAAEWAAFQELCRAARASGTTGLCVASDFGVDVNLDRPFVASELIAQPSVSELVQRQGPVPVHVWLHVLRDVSGAFAPLRQMGISHGDLKPQNLFLSPEAPTRTRISDLGMILLRRARAPQHGPGSLGFCPPEELDGRAAPSPAGDVYALALVTFYALTARHSCRAMWDAVPDPALVRRELAVPLGSAAHHAESLGGALPRELDAWFARALDADPAKRFPTVLEAAAAFEVASGLAIATRASELPFSPTIPAPPPESSAAPAGAAPTAAGVPVTVVDGATLPRLSRRVALAAGVGGTLLAGATVWGALRSTSESPTERAVTAVTASARAPTPAASASAITPPPSAPPVPAPLPAPETRARFECRPVDCEFIVCDGRNIPVGVREALVAPGTHRCVGSRYGYRSSTVQFEIREGTDTDVVFQLAPSKPAPRPKASTPTTKSAAKGTVAKSAKATGAPAAPKTKATARGAATGARSRKEPKSAK